eukprot:scaffold879_cov410-Prasinococcus_capsulatus_cf.AAC.14
MEMGRTTSKGPQSDPEWELLAELLPFLETGGVPPYRTTVERQIVSKQRLASGLRDELPERTVLSGILVEMTDDPNCICMVWEDFSQQTFHR